MLDKNEATLRNIDKTKTDVYELCGVNKRFKYEKKLCGFFALLKKRSRLKLSRLTFMQYYAE